MKCIQYLEHSLAVSYDTASKSKHSHLHMPMHIKIFDYDTGIPLTDLVS